MSARNRLLATKGDPESTAARLRGLSRLRPSLALVLGSGFQGVAEALRVGLRIAYRDVPGFPPVRVGGHAGELLSGQLGETPVLVLSGRVHYYEGHSMETVTFAVRVLAALGITDLLLTNAAGGISECLVPGEFMALKDHINFMGMSPLRGAAVSGGPQFVDLSAAYDRGLRSLLRRAATAAHVRLREGVYLAVSGPSFETPAEIRAFARLGADAVGMSTVPEVIVARQCGLRVAAVSCITNRAAGLGHFPLSHAEVLETAGRATRQATTLLENFTRLYGEKR
jgi:purine-nucleoside phosphorylase